MKSLHRLFLKTREVVDRWWYPFLIAFLTFVDVFTIVVPSDGILVSSAMMRPKKWIRTAFAMTVGSFLGGALFAALVFHYGESFVFALMPTITETVVWSWTHDFFQKYGLIVVFLAAASPVSFQPALFFAVIAHTPFAQIMLMLFAGRALKNFVIAWVSSHTPRALEKFWGIRSDLEEMGIHPKKDAS